jgi:hypothetical protein
MHWIDQQKFLACQTEDLLWSSGGQEKISQDKMSPRLLWGMWRMRLSVFVIEPFATTKEVYLMNESCLLTVDYPLRTLAGTARKRLPGPAMAKLVSRTHNIVVLSSPVAVVDRPSRRERTGKHVLELVVISNWRESI